MLFRLEMTFAVELIGASYITVVKCLSIIGADGGEAAMEQFLYGTITVKGPCHYREVYSELLTRDSLT